ncbi:hypothetical protein LOTGIDRAFT_237552 [Lottia gigantea]|uniref:Uncharacterized protein n=1 Tax=Lottia gigantea TaxID=225164 RepID=V4CMV1_LOTGI|nr:hypothetical protein LOTGIDRAFT_237552 [Lottia gigantea]ESP03705.1 hypothetical protein LOTGIDRAFT_237552 [Lottia gigantea]
MGELVMTSYRTQSNQTDDADPRTSLIIEPTVQNEASSQSSHRTNGHFCQNGSSFKNKNELKKKLPLTSKRTRCRILTAIILTTMILAFVAIILIICLKSADDHTSIPEVTSSFPAENNTDWTTEYLTTTLSSIIQTTTTSSLKFPSIVEYKTFPHQGDSRIFQIEDDSGLTIRAYGHKSHSGKIESLKHISVTDGSDSDTHIRLGTRNTLASVMLPDGTHISYDMSEDLRNMELRIFQGTKKLLNSQQPTAFVQSVIIDSGVSVLTKLLYTLAYHTTVNNPITDNKTCVPYLPLRVTKCGSQYPYVGAFIEGKVRLNGETSVLMAALSWPSEDNHCFPSTSSSNSKPNYYIPLPVKPSQSTEFCPSLGNLVYSVCSNPDLYDVILANETCFNLATKTTVLINTNNNFFHSVFNSCLLIFSTVDKMCTNLQTQAGVHVPSWNIKKDYLLGLCTVKTGNKPTVGPENDIDIKLHVLAFCPSIPPIRSPEQTINIKFNQSKAVGSPIHINCDGSPELTYMSIGHAYTGSDHLDRIMHRFKVCSICAFETSVRVVLKEDGMCCNNTCLDSRECNNGTVPAIEESTFKRHSSVYCHDFLADRGYATKPLHRNCLGSCDTKFSLEFSMFDLSSKSTFYNQKIMCYSHDGNSCKMEFGT